MKPFDLSSVCKQEITELTRKFREEFELKVSAKEKKKLVKQYKIKRRRIRELFMNKITISDLKVGEKGYINPARIRSDGEIDRIDPRSPVAPRLIPGESVQRGFIKKVAENKYEATVPISHYYAVHPDADESWPEVQLRMGH